MVESKAMMIHNHKSRPPYIHIPIGADSSEILSCKPQGGAYNNRGAHCLSPAYAANPPNVNPKRKKQVEAVQTGLAQGQTALCQPPPKSVSTQPTW